MISYLTKPEPDNSKKEVRNTFLILFGAFILLLPALFLGLDLCDTGFYLTFYENIFSAPDSVEYNFMYYLTGVIGGVFMALFPDGGALWMRIVGIFFLLGALWMVIRSYRGIVSTQNIAIGTLCIILAYVPSPLTLSYDIVSLFLISGSLACLLKGEKSNRLLPITEAGALAGIAIFARIPNILFFLLFLLLCWRSGVPIRVKVREVLSFVGGYLTGVVAILCYMVVRGDYEIFLDNLQTLSDVSSDIEASHNLGSLIMAQVSYYLLLLRISLKFAVIAIWCMIVNKANHKWLRYILYLPAGLYLCYMIILTSPTQILGAVSIPALIIMCFRRRTRGDDSLNIVKGALFIALLFPCGSDGGGNIGSILYLWAAPAVLSAYLHINVKTSVSSFSLPRKLVYGGIVAFAWIIAWQNLNGHLYFDSTPAIKMNATIKNKRMRGIFTSSERAETINELLPKLNEHVTPGDTLFAYGSIPMLNYLTGTRPFIGCSWPEQLSAQALEKRISAAENLPVVCVQRFSTIGNDWGQPSESFISGEEEISANVYHTASKWLVIEKFLERNKYQRIPVTPRFDLYLPPE